MATPGALYVEAQRSFDALARTLTAEEWATPLACTPGWSARDVLSHVAGIPDDAAAGRMDGVTTVPWTQAQVERNGSLDVGELLDRWAAQTPGFATMLDALGEGRAPLDCHTHEHDVRHGIGRPGNRESNLVRHGAELLATGLSFDFPVLVELLEGRTFTGSAADPDLDPVVVRGLSAFEMFRSRLGRRTLEQVWAYDWSGDPDRIERVIGGWFALGPSMTVIIE